MNVIFNTAWELTKLNSAQAPSTATTWIPACVPGAVQLDWAKAHNFPADMHYGQNIHHYDGLEDATWLYRTPCPEFELKATEGIFFRCGGVDYQCDIFIGDRCIHQSTGYQVPISIDVSELKAGEYLYVLIHPAPKRHQQWQDRSQADHVTKPAVSYGWDWHPRVIPLGIHTKAHFVQQAKAHIQHIDFSYQLNETLTIADIEIGLSCSHSSDELEGAFTWRLIAPDGSTVIQSKSARASLNDPLLWWTHDHGPQHLYELEVTLNSSGHSLHKKVGFRKVQLLMHDGAWDSPADFPKSRSLPPITLTLNGRKIFGKGSNWVNSDIFPGRVNRDRLTPLIDLAQECHFNILRCWGGAPPEADDFFELCDEKGLLVWQEFPLACNLYPDDANYLKLLDSESKALIQRLKTHPCVGLWCGGNELFNAWSGMTDQAHPLRLLNKNCFELDPNTPFIPTSPLAGMGHGDYRFRDDAGRDVFQIFQQAENTAYTEFGCPGPSSAERLKTFIPEDELFPPKAGSSWTTHHGFGSWDIDPTTWLSLNTLEHYFGSFKNLDELVAAGEWLQAEGYRSIYEEARRQHPRCSMALNWCFNEAWPCAANNSIISWPHHPKPSFYAVQAACRPVCASARIPHFEWKANDIFSAEIWMLNDSPNQIEAGRLVVTLNLGGRSHELLSWPYPAIDASQNLLGPSVRMLLPDMEGVHEFSLQINVNGQASYDAHYRLFFRQVAQVSSEGPRALNM